MNEPNPPIPRVETAPLPAYKDRSTGLVIFGILTLLLGCLAGLFVPLMLFGQMMAAKAPNAPPVNHATMLPGIEPDCRNLFCLFCLPLPESGVNNLITRDLVF